MLVSVNGEASGNGGKESSFVLTCHMQRWKASPVIPSVSEPVMKISPRASIYMQLHSITITS